MDPQLNVDALKALSHALFQVKPSPPRPQEPRGVTHTPTSGAPRSRHSTLEQLYNPDCPGYRHETWTNRVQVENLPGLCQRRDVQDYFQDYDVLDVNFLGPDRVLVKCNSFHQCQRLATEWNGRYFNGQQLQVKLYFH